MNFNLHLILYLGLQHYPPMVMYIQPQNHVIQTPQVAVVTSGVGLNYTQNEWAKHYTATLRLRVPNPPTHPQDFLSTPCGLWFTVKPVVVVNLSSLAVVNCQVYKLWFSVCNHNVMCVASVRALSLSLQK